MLRKANNVFSVALSDVTVATTTLPSAGVVVSDSNLTTGAIVMVDAGMRRTTLATLATGDTYHIVQGKGTGNPLVKSPAIVKGNETITSTPHKPAAQQITVIGSTGTTGSLPVANDTAYFIKVRKNDNDAANRSQPMSLFGQFKTDASGTQYELASGLANNLAKNMSLEPASGYLSVEILIDTAASNSNLTATTGNITFTKGSKVISAATDIDGELAVGDYIRVTGVATETITDPVYRVISMNTTANTAVLDIPYQGATATITSTNLHFIPAATGNADNFGIRLTGIAAPFDVNSFRNYYANRFTATFSDESILVTSVQGASGGSGVWQRVAMDEYMSYGYDGQNGMLETPPTLRDMTVKVPGVASETALTSKYSTINIAWTETITGLVSTSGAVGNVIVYLNLEDSSGSGILDTATANTGETLAVALGLTAADLDE